MRDHDGERFTIALGFAAISIAMASLTAVSHSTLFSKNRRAPSGAPVALAPE